MTLTSGDKRFQNGAQDYAAYLETPEGRLRTDLAFANLRDFLPSPQANIPLHALDVGCGTGAAALLLAGLGFHVTLLDSSQAMLDIAKRSAEQAGVTNRVTLRNDDALRLTNLFDAASFDIVLCHDILEYVEDPTSVLRQAARALRDTSAILSIVVRNQAGEVFKAAIQAGDLAVAAADLSAEWGHESLYGGRVRLFTATDRQDLLDAASLTWSLSEGYAWSPTTCRLTSPAPPNTLVFWSWKASWAADRNMLRWLVTRIAWRGAGRMLREAPYPRIPNPARYRQA